MNMSIHVESRARALFWHLIADDIDFLQAVEARRVFVRDHFYCERCDSVKHRVMFRSTGGDVFFPCKACDSVRNREWKQRKKGAH